MGGRSIAQSASSDVDIVFSKLDVNELVSNNQVYSIFKDHYGYMWIGGRGGLYKYDSIGCKSIAGFENEVIWSIYEDSRQVLWVGTEAGLFKSNGSTGNFTGYTYNPNNPERIDEFYSANLGQEVTRGMRGSASRGFYVSAKAPYGYEKKKVSNGGRDWFKLKPVSPEDEVVKRIFSIIPSGDRYDRGCQSP